MILQSTTEMTLIKWLLFLLMIAGTEGWISIRQKSDYSAGEEMMKTILESCYGENSFLNPVVIFGNFSKFIEGVSMIRVNASLNKTDYKDDEILKFKASSIILMEEPPRKLLLNLMRLWRTTLWDNRIPFFIIGKNTAPCTNSRSILNTMWRLEVLNSIYICPKSIDNTPEIYTLNPITNYAPYPWTETPELDDLKVFRQKFGANISCTHLTYDKTKILNRYEILAVDWRRAEKHSATDRNYFEKYAESKAISHRALQTVTIALNASGRIKVETGLYSMERRYIEGSADILVPLYTLNSYQHYPYLFPLHKGEMVAIVKLKEEVSTLEKIRKLWSTPVLITAAFALAALFLILMMKRWSFGSALLDITRFLTYTAIETDNRYQSFRIYFTTMLIFIVISNGVFQGKIAAFLTTREKSSPAESIHELFELGYQMYTPHESLSWVERSCPRCKFEGIVNWDECIELVLNSTENLCAIDKVFYESKYILSPLERVRESLDPQLVGFKCRNNWPLRDRFNGMTMRVVESGLPDFWEMSETRIPKAKRQSMEAEWASSEYRPVALMKLYFAFQLLAVGLFLSIIVLYLELCWDKFVNP